uniref:Synergin gamma n=1 Tax=Sinocyclocheilus grahami TaxID=75366 RepID=A0A672K1M3_SINGR
MCLFCSSFIYPVGGGIGPPQGMMPMQQQQQGFPMVQVMQPNMQGMMGMNFGAQMPGAMQIQTPGMQFMGQPQFMGMRGPGPQFPADLHKQMAEEHQKRLEQQQRMLEENRKRRQFEEQKQKLRLLSSVKPKTGEKSRDDALEAIKGNLDGFSRDAKMHPTPSSQSKKPDSSHSSVTSHSLPPAFSDDDDEFSGFVQGPVDASSSFPSSSLPPSSPLLRAAHISQPLEMGPGQHPPPSPLPHAVPSSLPVSPAIQHSSVISSSQSAFQGNTPLTVSHFVIPSLVSTHNQRLDAITTLLKSTNNILLSPCPSQTGVGVYPQQDMQPMVPSWLYNDSLIPELFKKVLEFTMTPTGIDTAKLYPILISSGLPREALGQIWALANRTTPGKLTKEELYTVLALIGVAQVVTTKADDDDFQDFQEAPKAGAGDDSFTDFQGETGGAFPNMTPSSQSGYERSFSSSYSHMHHGILLRAFRHALQLFSFCFSAGEGFADFKSVSADDGFTDFKTADTVSPLDPPDQAKFQPTFPPPFSSSQSLSHSQPVSLAQPRNHLNMADLDLFTTVAPPTPTSTADSKGSLFPSAPPSLVLPSVMKPPSVRGRHCLSTRPTRPGQDDFADFMAFGSSRDQRSETSSGDVGSEGQAETSQQRQQISTDKYDVFKQLSLEGGLAYDDNKESVGGSFLSLKSDNDDFADFQSSKFCTALGASDKSLVDKVAAFKQAKEDSASVKSLDLPSIGGSSVGKEDSEDALSIQLDMKLSDMGGDLKHVMSDSSLDLPGLSSHQPPAAESDDLKFDPFGTSAVSSLGSYDWPDKEDLSSGQSKKLQGGLPSSAVVQKKETSFGSSENITHTTVAKVTTFPIEDGGSTTESRFEAFADFGSIEKAGQDNNDDFGDFASTVSEKSDSPPGTTEAEGNQGELTDEFKAFQGDKPKFGKSDFLKASTQAKVKSSEEMIKNELATFDLSVQGSHKRSHSLGEKEIVRSIPSPAPEQPFRDRSNTLNEKPALPIIRDKYKDLTGEVEESERYAYEWQRCLESALQVITTANNTLNGISSSTVCTEVIQSAQGMEYLLGVVEVYRVTKHVELGIKATAVCSEKLQELLKDISRVWNNLMGFMSLANLTPDESSLDFSSCILRHGIKNAKELACGVCLLNVDSRSKAFNSEMDNFKLIYGGHQYHASCANFWINCVEPKPPGLILPDLL